ncbi:MAG: hypothetical protein DRI57_14195 [Deltaproteobacteria bacterium]|nr:MAG: hypothetical protein DRI57_14195 [Deltaproteobacteria bacterium]
MKIFWRSAIIIILSVANAVSVGSASSYVQIHVVELGSVYAADIHVDVWIKQGSIKEGTINGRESNDITADSQQITQLHPDHPSFNQVYATILSAKLMNLPLRIDLYEGTVKIRGVVIY